MNTGLCDMHIHTDDSPDAVIPAEELVRRGIAAGLGGLGFVAHLDLHPDDPCHGGFDRSGYQLSLDAAQSAAGEDIATFRGLEVGEPHRFEDAARGLADYSRYDFITGALHSTREAGMVLGPEAYRRVDPMEVVGEYLSETVEMVTSSDMDVLAHFGLFRRGLALAGHETSLDETRLFPGEVDATLIALIDRRIALEVNTSGLRRLEKTTYPTPSVVRRYRELGGELVTLGSDTHSDPWVFYGLEQGRLLLLETGFREAFLFRHRTPEAYPLS